MSYLDIRAAVAAHLDNERYADTIPAVGFAFLLTVLRSGR